MPSVKTAYGTNGQTFTCTLASLGSSATAGRESTAVDNTSDLFLDALVMLKVKTSASALANDKAVYVYAYGTVDNGTTYGDVCTGSDAAVTLTSPSELPLIGVIYCPSTSTTYKGGPFSVARAFGGRLPAKWGIVVRNYTGQNLDGTEGSHAKLWQGIYATVS
jgi:hypothetical protein